MKKLLPVRFHAQDIHRHLLKVTEQLEVVLNSRLGKRPVITGKKSSSPSLRDPVPQISPWA